MGSPDTDEIIVQQRYPEEEPLDTQDEQDKHDDKHKNENEYLQTQFNIITAL
jgi:hypothetical protein